MEKPTQERKKSSEGGTKEVVEAFVFILTLGFADLFVAGSPKYSKNKK